MYMSVDLSSASFCMTKRTAVTGARKYDRHVAASEPE